MGDSLSVGWYRLPSDEPHIIRYWDGTAWSGPHVLAHTNASGVPPADPPPRSAPEHRFNPSPSAEGTDTARLGLEEYTIAANPPDLAKAGAIGPRLLARAVDTLIELCLYLVLLLPARSVSIGHQGFWKQFPGMSSAPPAWAVIAGIVAFFAWEWAWVSQRGATPGKQLAGLYVVTNDPSNPNDPLPSPQLAARRFAYRALFGIPILGFLIWSLEAFVSLWYMREDTEKHRSLPDRLAGTRVVGSVYQPQITTMPSGRAPVWILLAVVTFIVLAAANWRLVQTPVFSTADEVMREFQDGNLAEATASFAQSCPIDRQRYAEYFSRVQITSYELDRADVDWAVPFFSAQQDRSKAIVTGSATALQEGTATGPYAVTLQLVREDGEWRPCELLS